MSTTTPIATLPSPSNFTSIARRVSGRRALAGLALALSVAPFLATSGCDLTRDVASCRLESLCKPALDTPQDDPNPRPMIGN